MTTTVDTAPPATAGAPTRRGNAWLVAGAVLGAVLVAMSAMSFAGMVSRHADSVAVTTPAAARLVVHSTSGNVTVTGADRDDIAGTARRTWSFARPTITTDRVGDTVELRVDCGWAFTGYCDATFDLQVPAGTAVDLHTSSGDVAVSGLRGDATLATDSGRVSATDVVGRVAAGTGSGDIALSSVTGDLDLRVDSGNVDAVDSAAAHVTARTSSGDVRLDLRDDAEAIDARSSSGQVAIRLPDTAGVAYRLDLRTSSGGTAGEVRSDPDSPRTITGTTSSGDVSVAYR